MGEGEKHTNEYYFRTYTCFQFLIPVLLIYLIMRLILLFFCKTSFSLLLFSQKIFINTTRGDFILNLLFVYTIVPTFLCFIILQHYNINCNNALLREVAYIQGYCTHLYFIMMLLMKISF